MDLWGVAITLKQYKHDIYQLYLIDILASNGNFFTSQTSLVGGNLWKSIQHQIINPYISYIYYSLHRILLSHKDINLL